MANMGDFFIELGNQAEIAGIRRVQSIQNQSYNETIEELNEIITNELGVAGNYAAKYAACKKQLLRFDPLNSMFDESVLDQIEAVGKNAVHIRNHYSDSYNAGENFPIPSEQNPSILDELANLRAESESLKVALEHMRIDLAKLKKERNLEKLQTADMLSKKDDQIDRQGGQLRLLQAKLDHEVVMHSIDVENAGIMKAELSQKIADMGLKDSQTISSLNEEIKEEQEYAASLHAQYAAFNNQLQRFDPLNSLLTNEALCKQIGEVGLQAFLVNYESGLAYQDAWNAGRNFPIPSEQNPSILSELATLKAELLSLKVEIAETIARNDNKN